MLLQMERPTGWRSSSLRSERDTHPKSGAITRADVFLVYLTYNTLVMRMEWSNEHLVFSPAIDSDHRKLFEQIEKVRRAAEPGETAQEPGLDLWRLSRMLSIHFASEERLMRECCYPAIQWHSRQHQTGRNKMGRVVQAAHMDGGQRLATSLAAFASWFKHHIHLADRMFAAHLRNEERSRMVS